MKKILLFPLFLLVSAVVCAQDQQLTANSQQSIGEVFDVVDQQPEPNGGMEAFYRFLALNIEYPLSAMKRGVSGKVFVRFVVTEKGEITSVEVLKGADPELDAEAVRVVKLSGDKLGWVSGKQAGKEVSVRKIVPVTFSMRMATHSEAQKLDEQAKKQEAPVKAQGPRVVDTLEGKPVYVNPDVWPVLKGKAPAHQAFFNKNLKYPKEADGAAGEVIVSFIVTEPEGIVKNVQIHQSIHPALDAEALKVVESMSKEFGWKSGTVKRKKVHTKVLFPITFKDEKKAERAKQTVKIAKMTNSIDFTKDKLRVTKSVDLLPQPKEGMENLYDYLYNKMKYPNDAIRLGIEGVVEVEVFIKANGDSEVVGHGDKVHPSLNQEAAWAMQLFNKEVGWLPARLQGEAVDAKVIVPVRFKLDSIIAIQEVPINEVAGMKLGGANNSYNIHEIFDVVEEEATPLRGMSELYEVLSQNIEYPREAARIGAQGIAYVRFVINEEGSVESAEIVEGRELGHGLDEEAIRVIKLTKWNPAKQRGRYVKQRKILPIKFKLTK